MEFEMFTKKFSLEEARRLSPLALAFVGDGVFELIVRSFLVSQNTDMSAHKLHLSAITYVKAHEQSELVKSIMDILTEEELTLYKRGRNTKSSTVPKNADVQEYRAATGFEALIGFLYLTDQTKRIQEILKNILIS